ncbi:hypothetical protein C7974DRAFT_414632 [Boeremia exigua]|uniref:uncharacterized protein n=1 Tax=Boeremia exigua TaxID=749465 RepID=UPI001E8E1112|nr:uncharacterized protein C7974DRAFT_414632 [Boeremia exigua]KAH6621953.1 hypothetical protein C7974DRAFT_414632 [Boeremia exigua]
MTPPSSVVQGADTAPPTTSSLKPRAEQRTPAYQEPMQHVITIEHGDNRRSWRTIHEHVLCSHSQYMQQTSARAEQLREKYDSCSDILDKIELIVHLTLEEFEAKKVKVKLLSLVDNIEKYPLQEYQKRLDKVIGEALDQQFTNKNTLQSEDRPKTLKNFQALCLKNRLSFLDAEGALDVAHAICAQLQKIKGTEGQKARNNVHKAWAQGRLLLREATENSVLLLVEWAYLPNLPDVDAEQLYDLWRLARRLKIVALAEECVDQLFKITFNSIQDALLDGVPLRRLLGLTSDPHTPDQPGSTDETVTFVFHHVLKDDKPPAKLSDLVIETMAKSMDLELWSQIQPEVNHNTARKLIEAMVAFREVKTEQNISETGSVKHEGQLRIGGA